MAIVHSDGVDIAYEILNAESSGVPVFFIAGLAGFRQGCMAQAVPFSKQRPVVLHDHRGTGESARPEGVYSVDNMAGDVIAIMDDAGIDRAHFVGTSTGGAIIQVICLTEPSRVQSAAICCSWPKSDAFFKRQFDVRKQVVLELGIEAVTRLSSVALYDPKYFSEHVDEIEAKETASLALSGPPQVAAERMDAIVAHDVLDRLPEITAPVLVACARNDAVCPPYFSEQIAAAIPGAKLKVYDDGGHFFYLARTQEFNADLAAFIDANEE